MDEDEYALRKMKDFLLVYNKMAETCFHHCINSLTSMNLTKEEIDCVEYCSAKSLNTNHRLMQAYVDIQPEIMNRRMQEVEKQTSNQVSQLESQNTPVKEST